MVSHQVLDVQFSLLGHHHYFLPNMRDIRVSVPCFMLLALAGFPPRTYVTNDLKVYVFAHQLAVQCESSSPSTLEIVGFGELFSRLERRLTG